MNMGAIIRELRKKYGLTQEQLGALTGKAESAVRSWELGLSMPQPKTIVQLCETPKTTPNEIFEFFRMVNEAEPEDGKEVSAVWIGTADGYADGALVYDMWKCSNCGYDADGTDEKPMWKFCPQCGARMRGEEE